MKIRITMKNPDCVSDALDDAVDEAMKSVKGVDEDEIDSVKELKREKLSNAIGRWVEYDEYITIEIDTDANTAIVIPV